MVYNEIKHIIYVDDDEDDRMLLQTTLKEYNNLKLSTLETGQALFDELSKTAPSQLPSLIVLDINMPRLSGTDILQILKENERYKDLRVVMFTTGEIPYSKITFDDLRTDVIKKPFNMKEYAHVGKTLLSYCG